MSNDQLEFAHNPDGSVQRRTIVSGVAWTIPVVAMASAPPAAAASLQPTLEFVNGPYTIAACGTLDDVLIHATTDGITPAPVGTVVTVTVPAGLSLPNGLQTQDFLTDVNGDVVISGITAARSTTGGPVTAVAGTAAAGSSISVVQSGVAKQSINQGVVATWSAVPADAVPVGGGYFLTPGGDLYWQNDLVASGVTSATGEDAGGFPNHGFLMQNGVAKQAGEQVVPANSTWSSIPADAVPVGGVYFLTPGGDLYFGNDVVASGVTSAKGEYTDSGWLGYFVQSGVAKQSINQGVVATWSAVPADAVPVGGGYFLTPGGDLYWQNDLVASGVTSATGEDAGGFPNHGFLMQNGVAKQAGEQVVPASSTWSSIPADAVPVGGVYFLTPGGDLYFGNDVVASGVTSAKGEYTDNGWLGYFIQGPVC